MYNMYRNYMSNIKVISSNNSCPLSHYSSRRYSTMKSIIQFDSLNDKLSDINQYKDIPFIIINDKGHIRTRGDKNHLVYETNLWDNCFYFIRDMFKKKMTFKRFYDAYEEIYYNQLINTDENTLYGITRDSDSMIDLTLYT